MYSKDSNIKPETIVKIAKKVGLNGIAITDHDSIKGGVMASKKNKDKNFEVVIGSEIRTKQAEVLGYYLQEDIKSDDIFEVLDKIKEQGGVSIISHPFALLRTRLKCPVKYIENKVNGLECFNGKATFSFENRKAHDAAREYNLAMTGGSDAHSGFEIGRAFTVFNGRLSSAIIARKTKAEGSTRYSELGKFISLGHRISKLFQ